ncbi:hypothetical protein pdam_00017262, partial [Pocillopora damicornis]
TPLCALTGTADPITQETIKQVLNLAQDIKYFYELDWLITLLRNEGVNCPKTTVFCNTINEIALVTNHIMSKLGSRCSLLHSLLSRTTV